MATTVVNPADLDAPRGNNAPIQLEAPQGMRQGASRQNLPANSSAGALAVGGGLTNIMSQPAVKKAMPTIIVMMAVALFLLARLVKMIRLAKHGRLNKISMFMPYDYSI